MVFEDVTKFLEADIPDPTDFPSAAPGLRQLDEATRCAICRELFDAPVSVNCGHTFCSLCIRSSIMNKPECPLCRGQISEFHVRRNPTVEDAVKAWKEARPFTLRILDELEQLKQHLYSSKKRKRSLEEENANIVEIMPGPKRLNSQADMRHKTSQPGRKLSSPNTVECPVCQRQIVSEDINTHIDACLPSIGSTSTRTPKGKQKQEWSRLFGSDTVAKKGKCKDKSPIDVETADPLPKVAYYTMKEKALRGLLAEHGLPTAGDKDTMIARHQRWVLTFNANLDYLPEERKTLRQLRLDLRKWEGCEEKKKPKFDTKNMDTEAYQKQNRTTFSKLIEAARPNSKLETSNADSEGVISTNEGSSKTASEDESGIIKQEKEGEQPPLSSSPTNDIVVVDDQLLL